MSRKLCQGKRCFKSAGAARRSANERQMIPSRVYKCPRCHYHHVTSSKALHADTDQDHRPLDPLEKLQQERFEQARADRKFAQAIERRDFDPVGPHTFSPELTAYTLTRDVHPTTLEVAPGVTILPSPFMVDEIDEHNGPGSTVSADDVHGITAIREWFATPDMGEPLAYTPDEQFESGAPIVLSAEAFDELTHAIENPRPPNEALIELMRDTAVG